MRLLAAFALLIVAVPASEPLEAPDGMGNAKIDPQWHARWLWQGGGSQVHLIVNTRDGFDLGAWADARGQPWHRVSQHVSGYLLMLPLRDVPLLASLPGVTYVEFDHPMEYHMATSSVRIEARGAGGFGGAWFAGPDAFEAPLDLAVPITGKGVTVAVLDTGLDETHPDFGGFGCDTGPLALACQSRVKAKVQIEEIPYFQGLGGGGIVPYLGVGDEAPTTDTDGHGTHTAGTVGGNGRIARAFGNPGDGGDGQTIGIAPEVSIVSVAIGAGPHAGLSSAAQGWVLDHAAEYEIRVTSNSYGCAGGCAYSPNSLVVETARTMYDMGIVTVWSQGNNGGEGGGAEMGANAQIPWSIGVAAFDDRSNELAYFSSRGAVRSTLADPSTWTPEQEGDDPPRRPDVAAPGVNIESTAAAASDAARLPVGSQAHDAYTSASGTSMAAPHVAGAVALLIQACPSATPLDLMRAVFVGADPSVVAKTSSAPGDLPATPVSTGPYTYGTGPAEPFERGYGALRVRASLAYLLDEVCPQSDVRTPMPGFGAIQPLVAQQFLPTSIPLAGATSVRGLPEGLVFDGAIRGTPFHAGRYNLQVTGSAGITWQPLLVMDGQLANAIDPHQGIVGLADAFGLAEPVVPIARGTAFLAAPATVTAHLAACDTACEPPGSGIPVAFLRGLSPDGGTAELRMQQNVPQVPDVRSIALAPGPVEFSIEAGAFAGGARLWVPDAAAFGYEEMPVLVLPFDDVAVVGEAKEWPLVWRGRSGSVTLAQAPEGMVLESGSLRWTPRIAEDAAVWLNVTDGTRVQQQGLRVVAGDGGTPSVVLEPKAAAPPPGAATPAPAAGPPSAAPPTSGSPGDEPDGKPSPGSKQTPSSGWIALPVVLWLLRRRR